MSSASPNIEVRSILVPVDFSDASRAGLQYAASLARAFDATVKVLHVWTAPVFVDPSTALSIADGRRTTLGERAEQDAKAMLERLYARVADIDAVRSGEEIVFGDPAFVIVEHSQGFDLIVLGTHQRKGPRRWWLGSVAEKVVRHSHSPVVTVPESYVA